MITMTIEQFETLLTRKWEHRTHIEELDTVQHDCEMWDSEAEELRSVSIPHTFGEAVVTSTCPTMEGITITYLESYNYDEHQPETFTSGTDGLDEIWQVEGVVVVDEDGEELNAHEVSYYLDGDFSDPDYRDLIESIPTITDIDTDEDSDVDLITLSIDNEPNLRFTGEEIASAASTDNNAAGSSYSGQTGRWTELSLYRTKGGKYVCHQVGRTCWQGERDRYSGAVCETLDEVKAFFGHRWLAKELYAEAGISDAIDVE